MPHTTDYEYEFYRKDGGFYDGRLEYDPSSAAVFGEVDVSGITGDYRHQGSTNLGSSVCHDQQRYCLFQAYI